MEYGDAPAEERPHFVANIWWPDYNDPWSQLYPNFHSDSIGSKGSNSSYYANKEVDALLDQMRDASTEDEIREATRKVLQIMMWDDPAAIFYASRRGPPSPTCMPPAMRPARRWPSSSRPTWPKSGSTWN
ncbi:hypothetical protein NRB20_75920 [Nocardia sp. RB20]|uniref:Uncharacterized protein n=1 Tax=Nocardia macrotermitis TaxID=2585198 RepID=A0A7K0DF77_9NOCA|nr:hypothetical protein [Nocardia macrotermitis]